MTPERWQQVKALLDAALRLDRIERSTFLDQACAGDTDLRRELDSLISFHGEAGDFIESPAFELMAESLTETSLGPGNTIGPYQIISRLQSGGMGELFLAEDTRLGRKVVLKTLPPHFTRDVERVRRFQLEARAASALSHPNIITIYEIGKIDALHYIAIEFIDGETLRERMTRSPLKISEALEIAIDVSGALLAAHSEGIVHRDIKPENIMIRADHVVKVLDFGLAKLTESTPVNLDSLTHFQTAPGIVMGTVPYMSPEQARALEMDPRSDIWSLGAVLYEMIGGRRPFEGPTTSDVIAAILSREPVPLLRYHPEVPIELEWIIKKALRKDREERYQTIKELLADLRNLKQRLVFEEELGRSQDPVSSGPFTRVSALDRQERYRNARSENDSLAILPLLNNYSDHSLDYLTDGITENMINTLSRLPELRVMAWSTVSRYKGQEVDPRQAGRELSVRTVLTGRVIHSTDSLLVKVEMVEVSDGAQLWADSYSCKPTDILNIEPEISREISEKLLLRLTSDERNLLARRQTANVDAYHAYLRGRYCWNRRTDEDLRQSIDYFTQAINADAGYALAYVGLADAYLVLGSLGIATLAPDEAFPKAREAAARALELDDTLAEAHASLAFCLGNYDWNWKAAATEFERALTLKPNYPTAHHWYGFTYLASMGQLDEALAEVRQALDLDPLSLPVSANIGFLLYLARRPDEALEQFQKTLEMDRNFVYTHWQMALAYEQGEQYEAAIAALKTAISLAGRSTLPRALLARTYALSGRKTEALRLLDELNELGAQTYVSPSRIAAAYSALGEKNSAFEWLESAFEGRDNWLIWVAVDPAFDNLRTDNRFSDLIRRVGLSPGRAALDLIPTLEARPARKRPKRSSGKLRGHAGFIIVSALLLITVGYFVSRFWKSDPNAGRPPQSVSFRQLTFDSGPEFFPTLSPDGKWVAYASHALGNWDIYLLCIGTPSPINLTKDVSADDSQPAFSPDGREIAFRSEREGGGIFIMAVTGEVLTRVSDFGFSPSWSPDGSEIVIGTEKIPQPSTRPTRSQLWTINVKTGQRRKVLDGDALQPTFSPHQKRIAYWSRPDRYGQREHILTVDINGGSAVAATDGTSTDLNPVWSPDGRYLFYSSNRGGSSNIWRVAIDEDTGVISGKPEPVTSIGANTSVVHLNLSRDGKHLAYSAQTELRNLQSVPYNPVTRTAGKTSSITAGSQQLWFPDVSPDGQWLTAYSMGQQRHIFIMRTDGTNQRDLTPDNFRHAWPRWSPDGKRIAFTSRRTGDYELWIMGRDGSDLQQLTQSSGGHYSPWSPDGSMIAYSIHTPKNDCIIVHPEKSWSEQNFVYLPVLNDEGVSFEGWSWSPDGKKLAGIRHLPSGVHSGVGIYDLDSRTYDWLSDFGDWPIWLNDNRQLLFVSQGSLFLFDTLTRKYQHVLTVTDQDLDIGSPAISRDNRTIYFTHVAAEADLWLMEIPDH